MTISLIPVRELVNTIRDELSERREARARYNAMRRELANYRTPREVNDLLGVIEHQEGPEVQQIRDILFENQRRTTELYRAA
jgi:hypothetical protein